MILAFAGIGTAREMEYVRSPAGTQSRALELGGAQVFRTCRLLLAADASARAAVGRRGWKACGLLGTV